MIDGNVHTHIERYGAHELQWANRVDAAGSRIEWRIETDTQGWVSRYGPVFNQGVLCGSRAISGNADEQALLQELRARLKKLAGTPIEIEPSSQRAA
jgi:hypothetical protein